MKTQKYITIPLITVLFSIWLGSCLPSTPSPSLPAPGETPKLTGQARSQIQTSMPELASSLQGLNIDEFFEASYRELLLRDPELILETGLEDVFGIDQAELTDISDAYILETQQMVITILEMLRAYEREALTGEQQVSYDVYEAYLDDLVRGQEFMYKDYLVTFLITNGAQVQLLNFFTEIHPITNQQDAEDYITRLDQVDTKVEQIIEGLKLRHQAGIITPQVVYRWSLGDIQGIANASAEQTPYYTSFEEKVNTLEGVSDKERQTLLKDAQAAIKRSVIPAYKSLAKALEDREREAPYKDGIWQFEDGEGYYTYLLQHHTTTDLTSDEINELGQVELEGIQAEMRTIFDELDYPADWGLTSLYTQAGQDSGFVAGDQMVETYEEIITQAESNLDVAFNNQPKAKLIVIGGPIGGYYIPGSLDGARPGAFYADTSSGSPRFSMPTLAYHEGVPGHHFQIALAQEMDLPTFRNNIHFTAYAEGWALYAERLAWELGWYQDDPYGDLGRLQMEAFRAARLVVDTGIHTKGWTFDQAVEYMVENTGLPTRMVQGEIGRYIVWPGQATAYKIGMNKILELRQRAVDQLGDQFDLKEFHNVVLGNGAMPLDVLERVVQDYIDTKQQAK